VHRNACNTRPGGAGQIADQHDQPKADADWQKPTHCCRSRAAAFGMANMRLCAVGFYLCATFRD